MSVFIYKNQKMHLQSGRDYFMLNNEPKMFSRRQGVNKRSQRKLMLKNNYDGINQSQKQYFPDNSSRNNIDITSGNKSSKSFNHSPNYRKLNSQASRGITVNSSRRTLKSYQSELEKQIERLNSEIDEKDREFCRKNAKKTDEKIKESQIVQLYRIINYYEGKLKAMELDIKIYEEKFHRIGKECDERSQHKTAIAQLVSLFEKMRTHNQELHGEVEEKNYDIGNLRDQLKKMEYKYFSMSQNKILQKKKPRKLQIMKQRSEVKKKFFTPANVKERMQQYGNVQSKINLIESNLQFLKKQNQKLQNQLIQKDYKIQELQETIVSLKKKERQSEVLKNNSSNNNSNSDESNKKTIVRNSKAVKGQEQVFRDQRKMSDKTLYQKADPLNQVITLPKTFLRQVKKPQSKQKISEKEQSLQIPIRKQIFRKLKYNLIPEDICYKQFIYFLGNENFQTEKLQEQPYSLTQRQSKQVQTYLTSLWEKVRERESQENVGSKVREELKKKIQPFDNITIRKQNNLKIQISNQFMNRQQQFLKTYKEMNKPQECNFDEIMNYFKGWGFSNKHLDYIGKLSYENTGYCQFIDLSVIKSNFLEDQEQVNF